MSENGFKNFVRTLGVVDKKPIVSNLIVYGELKTSISEIDPSFGDVVSNKASHCCATHFLNVIAQLIPQNGLRQVAKVTRTIFHDRVEQVVAHDTLMATYGITV